MLRVDSETLGVRRHEENCIHCSVHMAPPAHIDQIVNRFLSLDRLVGVERSIRKLDALGEVCAREGAVEPIPIQSKQTDTGAEQQAVCREASRSLPFPFLEHPPT